uniref:Uncharacterized protein n=1 Tax=Anguilla anguilla TaxID=7936 RepID=A0A0E9U4Z9_ANGAN
MSAIAEQLGLGTLFPFLNTKNTFRQRTSYLHRKSS